LLKDDTDTGPQFYLAEGCLRFMAAWLSAAAKLQSTEPEADLGTLVDTAADDTLISSFILDSSMPVDAISVIAARSNATNNVQGLNGLGDRVRPFLPHFGANPISD
jgi:hypothetical protein